MMPLSIVPQPLRPKEKKMAHWFSFFSYHWWSRIFIHSLWIWGTDEVVIGDGLCLVVSYMSPLALHSPKQTFIARNTLCSKYLQKFNFSTSPYLTKWYCCWISSFLWEKITWMILLRDACENDVYIFFKSLVTSF